MIGSYGERSPTSWSSLTIMNPIHGCILGVAFLAGCGLSSPTGLSADKALSLAEARKGFSSQLNPEAGDREPAPEPPPRLFRKVKYEAPAGKLAAYLSPDPTAAKKHAAVVWITGGDCNSIHEGCGKEGPPSTDQSSSS